MIYKQKDTYQYLVKFT